MSNLQVIEFKSQRVLTTQQLAGVYECTAANIQQNYNNHQDRFTDGKDFYKLEGAELKEFKRVLDVIEDPSIKFASVLILWTSRGANRHSKILDTDKAWQQFDMLEETYFQVKNGQTLPQMTELEILARITQHAVEQEKAINQLSATQEKQAEEIKGIRDIVALNPNDWRKDTSDLIGKMARNLGGNEHIQDLRKESYKLLDERFAVKLKIRLSNLRKNMLAEGCSKSKVANANNLDVIALDKKLIEGYVIVVKDMAIKYGIKPQHSPIYPIH